MERCNPINEVTYITYTTPDISYNIKDLLLVRWSEAECNNIKTVISFSSLQGRAFHVEGNTISDGDIIPLDKPLKYVSKGDETTIGKTDIAKLDYKDESGTYTLVSCERRIITCGLNCARCDENKCIECMNGYSFLESLESTGCVLKSDYDTEYQKTQSMTLLKELYKNSGSNYEKLQIYRIMFNENSSNSVIKKFVNETFHIENDYLFQLNPCEYDTVPQYIIDECDKDILEMA